MEFPSTTIEVSHDNTYHAAKVFLDNERGDTNEIVSNGNTDVKDFLSEQSKNNSEKVTGDNSESNENENINGNTVEQKFNEGNQELTNKDVNTFNISEISNEEDKFREKSKTQESSLGKDKFINIGNSSEDFELGFKSKEVSNIKSEADKPQQNDVTDEDEDKKGEEISSEVSDSKPGTSKVTEENEEWMDILGSGQLKKKTIKPGIPDTRPQKSDICLIDIIGKLEDGTVFEDRKCLEINLGDNETVQGLDFVLALMDKGEEADVIVASRFGYGSLGLSPLIPPDATLYFNITLMDVKQEPLISKLNINERIAIGGKKKERGNFWYQRDEHSLAIHSYRRALDYLDDTEIPDEPSDEQVKILIEERLKTYNNLGASQMKIWAYDAALMSIDQVLNCQPKNVKALFRKSKILKEKGELAKSIEVIRQALQIEPESKGLQQELSLLLAAQRKDNTLQRNLYKKMMGNSSNDNETEKKKKSQFNSYKWVAALSFAVAVIGAVAFKYRW